MRTFAIITTRPNAEIAELHNRMPLVIEPKDWPAWLGEVEADPAAPLGPPPDSTLRAWPVSRAVNAPRNNGPELLEPADDTSAASGQVIGSSEEGNDEAGPP